MKVDNLHHRAKANNHIDDEDSSESSITGSIDERMDPAAEMLETRGLGYDYNSRRVNYPNYGYYNPRLRPEFTYPLPYDNLNDDSRTNQAPQINQNFNFPPYNPSYQMSQPYYYPPYLPYFAPRSTSSTTTTTTTKKPDDTKPIGYMLINTYETRGGSISRPIAFFKTKKR